MLIEEIPLKLHQKILRELYIAEALVDVLNVAQIEYQNFEISLSLIVFRCMNKIYRMIKLLVYN